MTFDWSQFYPPTRQRPKANDLKKQSSCNAAKFVTAVHGGFCDESTFLSTEFQAEIIISSHCQCLKYIYHTFCNLYMMGKNYGKKFSWKMCHWFQTFEQIINVSLIDIFDVTNKVKLIPLCFAGKTWQVSGTCVSINTEHTLYSVCTLMCTPSWSLPPLLSIEFASGCGKILNALYPELSGMQKGRQMSSRRADSIHF